MTNSTPADWLPDDSAVPNSGPASRLYFQVAGSAVAWVSPGLTDVLITWRACIHEEEFGGASAHPAARAVYFVMTTLLFSVAILAGGLSYSSWKKLSGLKDLLHAEGRECSEFMSLAGLYVSLTLGAGIVWLCIPLFVLRMCVRTR